MSQEMMTTTISILGKSYQIKCPVTETNSLKEAAHFLDKKFKDALRNSQPNQHEKIIILTALNLTHQLLNSELYNNSYKEGVEHAIQQLNKQIDRVLNKDTQGAFNCL